MPVVVCHVHTCCDNGWLLVQVQGLPSYMATNIFTNLATWLQGSVAMVTVCTPTRTQCWWWR